jgi:hypothetical protein
MPKAYDRVKNADNHSDVFIRTPYWTNAVEAAFEEWAATRSEDCLARVLDGLLDEEVGVSFKAMNGSVCATLAHQTSKAAGLPYLLTGWSDNAEDALYVAIYKLEKMLQGIWKEPEAEPTPRRH